jgi:hypothetical protein
MTTSEENQLQAELEESKQDLQQDLSEIEDRVRLVRARLSPARFIVENALLALGIGLAVGFVLGWRDARIEDLGKPIA